METEVAYISTNLVVLILLAVSSRMSGFPIPTDAPAWSPAATIYLKVWIVSTIISAMAYGGVVSLALSYIPLLLKTSNDISRSMRNFLLFYVTFMVAVSTIYIITMTVALTNNMFFPLDWSKEVYVYQNGRWGEFCVTLASWGADGFMVSILKIPEEEAIDSDCVSSGDVRYCIKGSLDPVGYCS